MKKRFSSVSVVSCQQRCHGYIIGGFGFNSWGGAFCLSAEFLYFFNLSAEMFDNPYRVFLSSSRGNSHLETFGEVIFVLPFFCTCSLPPLLIAPFPPQQPDNKIAAEAKHDEA